MEKNLSKKDFYDFGSDNFDKLYKKAFLIIVSIFVTSKLFYQTINKF
jgi:hypothetical protein